MNRQASRFARISTSQLLLFTILCRICCLLLLGVTFKTAFAVEDEYCYWYQERDKSLKEMNYTIRGIRGTFFAYKEPHVASYHKKDPLLWSMKKVEPAFEGRIGKFINLSREPVNLLRKKNTTSTEYDPASDIFLREIAPMSAQFFTCYLRQIFYFASPTESKRVLKSWAISKSRKNNVMIYDPYLVNPEQVSSELRPKELVNYSRFQQMLEFQRQYQEFTDRTWWPNAIREPISQPMWNANFFGQTHSVVTKETQFVTLPSLYEYGPIFEQGRERILGEDRPRLLEEYRTPYQSAMNLTLKVLSCDPRVFEIKNFLSPVETEHILSLANVLGLGKSTMGSDSGVTDSQDARTSHHTRVKREQTQVIDAIYRRAADLLQIDEALLRTRDESEYHPTAIGTRSIAEAAQLVHYSEGQQYAAHMDFISPNVDKPHQANRFATLLVYLNEDMKGGQTSFPRWVNSKTPDALEVTPEVGKAILFYNLLPDGNMDEMSLHSSKPVTEGEKWVMNLWIWDPLLQSN